MQLWQEIEGHGTMVPNDSNITITEQMCELLGPFIHFTDAFFFETRVTLCYHVSSGARQNRDTGAEQ